MNLDFNVLHPQRLVKRGHPQARELWAWSSPADYRSIYGQRILAFETERPFDEVDIDLPVDMLVGEAVLAAVRDRLGYA
jgi:hypothetical protein